jgi:hypothetical protein
MLRRTDREQAILTGFRKRAASLIGQHEGFGIFRDDNTFRGPSPSSLVMSTTHAQAAGLVVLHIQRKDWPWRREICIEPNDSSKESATGGGVQHSSPHFLSEQEAIIKRLRGNIW